MSDDLPRVLSLLSHELRSPLGVIRGYLRLLDMQADALSVDNRRAVAAAIKASDRLAGILDQTSRLAQLRRNDTPLEWQRVAVNSVVEQALDSVMLPDDPVITVMRHELTATPVRADAALLRSTVVALFLTLVKAQPAAATIAIVARHGRRADSGDDPDGVIVEIALAGLPVTTRDVDIKRGGIGLDLPLAVTTIALHGGDLLELRSGERLAGFRMWLPAAA